MEEEQLKRDARSKASALLSCSGSESEGDEVKSQLHHKSEEVMEENPNPEDLEEDDDSDDDEETDDEDEGKINGSNFTEGFSLFLIPFIFL